jgi:hypothetical protein
VTPGVARGANLGTLTVTENGRVPELGQVLGHVGTPNPWGAALQRDRADPWHPAGTRMLRGSIYWFQ